MMKILHADVMLTPAGEVADAELEIDQHGRIAYAGKRRDSRKPHYDLRGHALIPGLVNGHTHSAMALQRAISDDAGFMSWLAAVQAVEQRLTREDVVVGLELAMLEMIATGTTTFADMYHWDAGLLELVRQAGLRVLAAPAMFTRERVGWPGVSPLNGAQVLDQTEKLAERFAGDQHIRLAYGPHAPYTCPPEVLQEIAERSRRTGIPIHIHLSESRAEVAQITQEYGTTPAQHLAHLGFFGEQGAGAGEAGVRGSGVQPTGPSVLAAHCVHVTAEEIALLARSGAAVSHNPMSNLKLGCGIAPLPELIAAGVRVTLGTDSVASNNSLDLFEEIKLATVLHRGVRGDAAAVRAAEVLDIATRGGAEAIGFPETGALEVGRLADVVAVSLSSTRAMPRVTAANDPSARPLTSFLAFAATGQDVRHVFIGGRQVYADGRHLSLNAADILARAHAARQRLQHQLR